MSEDDTPGGDLVAEFTRLLIAGGDPVQREIDDNPTRFRQLIADDGGVSVAQRLLRGSDASDGFTTLLEAGPLALSVGTHVPPRRFSQVFSEPERRTARLRLERHGMDVAAFPQRIGDALP